MGTLFLNKSNGIIKKKDERLIFKEYETGNEQDIRLLNIRDIVFTGTATITVSAIHMLAEKNIYLHFVDRVGRYKCSILPPPGKNINLRLLQYKEHANNRKVLAKQFIRGKLKNQIAMLQRWKRHYHIDFDEAISTIKKYCKKLEEYNLEIDEIMGYEGIVAKEYYECFSKLLPEEFVFNGRNKRPPRDEINALLSYAYTLTTTQFITGLLSAGLDPYLGYLHSNVYGRPALALDIFEEFRPLIDSFVIGLVRNRVFSPEDFEEKMGTFYLKEESRRLFLEKYYERLNFKSSHPLLKTTITFQQTIYLQCKMIMKYLIGDIKYKPYLIR